MSNVSESQSKYGAFAGLTFLVAALTAATSAKADGREQGLGMIAVEDRSHGELVIDGSFETAMARNRVWARAILNNEDADRIFPFAVATNLCVAYTMADRLDSASVFCEAAMRSAEQRLQRPASNNGQSVAPLAVAHSNRGVLRALSGDEIAAAEDFRQALVQDAGAKTPFENLALLNDESELVVAK